MHHGAFITSLKQAERYVARGRARFVEKAPKGFTVAIRFIESDGRDVVLAHQNSRKLMDRGYDRGAHSGLASQHEMKMLPFAGLTHDNYVRMMTLDTKRGPGRHRGH